jgi:hypothetical protein
MSSKQYRTLEEAVIRLQELEQQQSLFDYKIDGYSAWRLLRFKAAYEIYKLPLTIKPDFITWSWLKERLSLFLPDIFAFIFPRNAKYVIKTFSSALSELQGNFYKDIYFDDIIDVLDHDFKIETLNNYIYGSRRRSALFPIKMTTAFIDLVSGFLTLLRIPQKVNRVATHISNTIQTEPSLRSLTPRRISRTLRRFYWSKRLYLSFLGRIKPLYVFTANTNEYAIWAAARELGILTIDFQHGIYSRYDPDVLPETKNLDVNSLILPDKLFLYGDYWKKELERMNFAKVELIPVGHHQIDHYRKIRMDKHETLQNSQECIIVLTTQGLDREQLIEFILKFLELAQGVLSYTLYIKLHPGYETTKDVYEVTFGSDPNVHILLGTEAPSTYALLANAHFHISIASATHYAALGIGVPTIILPLFGHEAVIHLAKVSHAKLVHTPDELLNYVMDYHDIMVPAEVSALYYKPGAINNIKRELGVI